MFALYGNGNESFNPVLDPVADPDHHRNLIPSKVSFPENVNKIPLQLLCNPADKHFCLYGSGKEFFYRFVDPDPLSSAKSYHI